MRITGIRTLVVNADMRNWVFVRVDTDQPGLHGWGEATLEWKTRAVAAAVQDLEPFLLGRDPRDTEQASRAMAKQGFWRPGAIGASAASGIEQALWDILGKVLDVPVWRLLGGKVRDHLPIYTHLGMGDMRAVYETFDPVQLAEHAGALVAKGYTALKVVFVPYTHYTPTLAGLDQVDRLMRTLRDAVGDRVDLMVDFHGRCASSATALQYIRIIAPYRPLFIEEPVPPADVAGLRAVTAVSPCAIASGERLVAPEEFEPLFATRSLHIAQPDLCHVGGFGPARKIAAMAEAAGIGLAPHNPLGPIAGTAALHFGIATPNVIIQEEMVGAVPWFDDVVRTPIRRTGGTWAIPIAPGLGVEVDEAEAARHPFRQEVLHPQHAVLPDGTIVDW